MTYGFLLSGLVRGVTGLTVGQFFAQEVARPLGLDLYLWVLVGFRSRSHR